jgi:hypothetical protein
MKDEASFSTSTTSTQYAAVASSEVPSLDNEYELTSATAVDLGLLRVSAASLYVDKPVQVQSMDARYANLAELQNLTWTDTFFDDDEGVIAAFDFDYDAMENFYTSVGWVSIAATMLYTPFFLASLVGLAPCYLRKNMSWTSRAQHVAITRDGIRFVRDRRPSCWGMPCTDRGKSSKTGTLILYFILFRFVSLFTSNKRSLKPPRILRIDRTDRRKAIASHIFLFNFVLFFSPV